MSYFYVKMMIFYILFFRSRVIKERDGNLPRAIIKVHKNDLEKLKLIQSSALAIVNIDDFQFEKAFVLNELNEKKHICFSKGTLFKGTVNKISKSLDLHHKLSYIYDTVITPFIKVLNLSNSKQSVKLDMSPLVLHLWGSSWVIKEA